MPGFELTEPRPRDSHGSVTAAATEAAPSCVAERSIATRRGVSESPASLCRCPTRASRAASAAAAVAAGALAATAAGAGVTAVAGWLALVMAALMLDARRWVRLAARSGVGARSEAQVRRALGGLAAEGWQLRHSLAYGGRGDIDSIAIAPNGIAYAIETKSRAFDERHLARARDTAAWLRRHRRRWCRRGALPVLCLARARGLERIEAGVLVVSLDRLVPALRARAGTSPRPGFLAT